MAAGLVLLLLCIAAFTIASRSFVIVNAWEEGLVFRYGRMIKKLSPGLNTILPFIDVIAVIDMRIRSIDVPPQKVITGDNAVIFIDAIIYYRPLDAEKMILRVAQFDKATVAMAQTTMRAIIGDMNFDSVNSERDKINARMESEMNNLAEQWGMQLISVEINEIEMGSSTLYKAIAQQVRAERLKRAAILESEGVKESLIINALGEKEAIYKVADGQAAAKIIRSVGEAKSIGIVAEEAKKISGNALSLWELEMWKDVSSGENANVLLPYNIKDFMKCMRGVGGK